MLCGAPSFTFVAVCLRLYILIFYTLTFYAPIFCSSLFSLVYLAPRLSFTSFFLVSILTPLFAYLIFYHSYYLTALPFCIILLSFLCFVGPFLHLCCCLFTPVYSHFLHFNVLRPHILLISIFPCLFGAPPFFHFFFSCLNFDAPICLSYILPFLLSHRPSVLYYFAFLLCFVAPLPSPLLLFVYAFIFPFLPVWRFWAFSYSFFLLNLFPFVTFFIFLSFPSILCPLFSFSSPFPFSFHFLSPFPFPFLLFTPSSLSSSFLLPLFDAPFGHFLAPPCGHPGCKRTLCTPQDTPLQMILPSSLPTTCCIWKVQNHFHLESLWNKINMQDAVGGKYSTLRTSFGIVGQRSTCQCCNNDKSGWNRNVTCRKETSCWSWIAMHHVTRGLLEECSKYI